MPENDNRDYIAEAYRDAGLTIGDPRLQDGLLDVVERGRAPIKIINSYEYREEHIRCAVCSNHQPHFRGLTVEFENGDRALCGKDCAEDFFGPDIWNALQTDLTYRRRNAVLSGMVRPLSGGVDQVLDAIDFWVDWMRDLVDAARSIRKVHNNGQRIRNAVSGGKLLVTSERTVWLQKVGRDGREHSARESITDTIVEVEAAAILAADKNPFGIARGGLKNLKILLGKNPTSNKELHECTLLRQKIINEINEGIKYYFISRAFFTPQNLRSMKLWIKHQSDIDAALSIKGELISIEYAYPGDREYRRDAFLLPDFKTVPLTDQLVGPIGRDIGREKAA